MNIDPEYNITIEKPTTDNRTIDDDLDIKVDFNSASQQTIHHVKVRIFDKATGTEVYNEPDPAHVHESDGDYEWEDSFKLSTDNGISADTEYTLEAKVWGHEAGTHEITETVDFTVNPQ